MLLFSLFPFVASFLLSFTKYNIVQPPEWIGTEHYVHIFTDDPLFLKSLRNTGVYVGGSVAIRIVLGFALALAAQRQSSLPRACGARSFICPRSYPSWRFP